MLKTRHRLKLANLLAVKIKDAARPVPCSFPIAKESACRAVTYRQRILGEELQTWHFFKKTGEPGEALEWEWLAV
jgi:hypothetical protein